MQKMGILIFTIFSPDFNTYGYGIELNIPKTSKPYSLINIELLYFQTMYNIDLNIFDKSITPPELI